MKHKQNGLALITVLLIFSIVSLLATALIKQQSTDRQRVGSILLLQKSRNYSHGVEELVKLVLTGDYNNVPSIYNPQFSNSKDYDTEEEDWFNPSLRGPMPVESGDEKVAIELKITDAQGLFNINSLHPTAVSSVENRARFTRILNALSVDNAADIAKSAADFIDENSQVESIYQSKEPAYYPSYKPLKHPSELLLIDGVTNEIFTKLKPYISTIPPEAELNVNTADSCILETLASGSWGATEAQAVISTRPAGFKDIKDFWALSEVQPYDPDQSGSSGGSSSGSSGSSSSGGTISKWNKANFSINSQYFLYQARVEFEQTVATVEGLIKRDSGTGQLNVIYRNYGVRLPPGFATVDFKSLGSSNTNAQSGQPTTNCVDITLDNNVFN